MSVNDANSSDLLHLALRTVISEVNRIGTSFPTTDFKVPCAGDGTLGEGFNNGRNGYGRTTEEGDVGTD